MVTAEHFGQISVYDGYVLKKCIGVFVNESEVIHCQRFVLIYVKTPCHLIKMDGSVLSCMFMVLNGA